MNKQDKFLRTGFTLFSAISSFMFVYYAVSVISSGNASQWLKTFAYVAGGYGLLNIYILSWAWRSQAAWSTMANMTIALCLLGVVVVDTIKEGFNSSMQIIVLLGLAAVLGINWATVKNLCQEDKP